MGFIIFFFFFLNIEELIGFSLNPEPEIPNDVRIKALVGESFLEDYTKAVSLDLDLHAVLC